MRGKLNDCMRFVIACSVRILGLVMTIAQRIRIARFYRYQERLRLRYAIDKQTPVRSYDSEIIAHIEAAAGRVRGKSQFAVTSGSTGAPKRLLFTKRRLRLLKLTFIEFFVRVCWAFSLPRTSLYVFSSLDADQSLTSMLLEETHLPSFFSTLQAPYRVQCHPSMKMLASKYGVTAVRLWILTISNPGVLYSTNPSTLSTFLDDLALRWQSTSQLIRDWHERPEMFERSVYRIANRLSSRGMVDRIRTIAQSEKPLSLQACVPDVTSYICWTGGYVQPFIDRIATYLPANRYLLIPMYSMSTETVETTSYIKDQSIAFLPMAPGVLYEFIAENDEDFPSNILRPDQLKSGHTYSMVVSDNYGLQRYQTGDLFLCEAKTSPLPNLRFLRRKNLEYSFTGEKLTGQQVSLAFQRLRETVPGLGNHFLTCVPSQPTEELIPHYKLAIVAEHLNGLANKFDLISSSCDQLLAEINCEYRSKRESGRLGGVRVVQIDRCRFIKMFASDQHGANWEAQFKFLPLYRQTWESIADC